MTREYFKLKITILRSSFLIGALFYVSASSANAENLINNGDFSNGFTSWQSDGWVLGQTPLGNTYAENYFLRGGIKTLSQQIKLEVGRTYDFSFGLRGGSEIFPSGVTLLVGGQSWILRNVGPEEQENFNHHSVLYTATQSTNDVVFSLDGFGNALRLDNISVTLSETAEPEPKSYGLFLGVQAGDFRGDLAAMQLADSFANLPNTISAAITANLADGVGIAKSAFEEAIAAIRDKISPRDKLVIYVTGHGGSSIGFGVGNEFIQTLPGLASDQYFTDDYLASQLEFFSENQKIVISDSCHSGGFWGSADPFEILDDGDLDTLSNIAMLTSSSEFGLAYYGEDGLPLISRVLSEYWGSRSARSLDFDSIERFVRSSEWHQHYKGTLVYEMGFGSPSAFDPNSLSISSFRSSDFDENPISGVPEPSSWVTFIIGFLAVGYSLRSRPNWIRAK